MAAEMPLALPSQIYSPLEPSLWHIRIATIIPNTDESAPIGVDLEVASLLTPVRYAALSYCWAGLSGTENILLCGQQFPVGKNLWEALRQFRSPDSAVRIWIDAICINQDDIQERSYQVRMMTLVYSLATTVKVWIGPATPNMEMGFKFLRHIMRRPTVDVNLDELPEEFGTAAYFLALGEIFRNPYWHRRWVTQEIFLARSTTIHCGNFEIGPFGKFEGPEPGGLSFITKYTDRCQAISRRRISLGTFNEFTNIVLSETAAVSDALIKFIDPQRAANPPQLNGFFRVQASVDHDYVYGLLGILKEDIGIVPDYTKDVAEVFADFAFKFMRHVGSAQLLQLANHEALDLPSWLPDFRHQHEPLEYGHPAPTGRRGYMPTFLSLHWDLFDASADLPFGIIRQSGHTLVLTGLIADQIIAVGDIWEETPDNQSRYKPTITTLAQSLELYQDFYDQGAFNDDAPCYNTKYDSANVKMAFIRTVSGGVGQDLDDPQQPWRRHDLEVEKEYSLLLFQNSEGLSDDHEGARLGWIELLAKSSVFFVTEYGRMGLGPVDAQVGDYIAIIGGSRMPIRLRSTGKEEEMKFTFHESVYVEGYMDGEAITEARGEDPDLADTGLQEIHLI
ncbi:heterokaryon incompatibility protein-domain-containing protein [Podospora aff. communis PSN243]|uniref:Heterokaryon incompatibility protein-domain-containing protein n=1 Tax=Podospora aff. communis PSN243 TaxID=3040156 RepID=A0AAV9GM10_9PEZI|nr:heterokaryon incompatibility protein-domain-containing protein [Podospora aff. communis PSN243]